MLIGEVWEDASNKIAYDQRRRYFTDRQLDSVMNYPWQKAILRYVRGEDDGAVPRRSDPYACGKLSARRSAVRHEHPLHA